MIVGHEKEANVDTAYWVDTWHNGDKGMLCRGPGGNGESATGSVVLRPKREVLHAEF